ncbi:CPBP family intramembrane metalloprotease [bacterium]|nr:CPBP family intramembrane metalloprotease [bacterium]
MNHSYRFKPFQYFIVTFVITWTFWFLTAFLSRLEKGKSALLVFLLLGLVTPFATALWMIYSSGNESLRRSFINKLLNIRLIKIESIPAILLIPPVSILLSISFSLLFGYSSDQFTISKSFSFSIGSAPTLLVLFLAACFEELGWRGYAMESISDRSSYFKATAVFSVMWSMWHFPLFFIAQTYQNEIMKLNPLYAVNFMISIVPLAFIISWLCRKNSSSIIAAILLHFVVNISQEFFMVEHITKCIQTAVLTVMAVVIVLMNKKMFFEQPIKRVPCND